MEIRLSLGLMILLRTALIHLLVSILQTYQPWELVNVSLFSGTYAGDKSRSAVEAWRSSVTGPGSSVSKRLHITF